MPSLQSLGRLVSLWFACTLLLAGLVMPVAAPVVGLLNAPFVNGAVSAAVAFVARASVPELRAEPVLTLGLLTLVGFAAGRWAAGRIGLPPESPAVSAVAWLAAFGASVAVLSTRDTAWVRPS